MEEQLQSKLKEAKAKIVANSKDAHFAKSLIDELVGLQKQADIEPTEIHIALSDVEKSYDFDAVKLTKTKVGKFIFEAKGGMWTIVDMRMQALYGALQHICDYLDNPTTDKDADALEQTFRDATMYAFQTPILCSLDQRMLYDVIAKMLESFREYSEELMPKQATPETEDDIKANIELENQSKAFLDMANAPIPDIE